MKTLQQQYNLIKEGKGDKNFFLKQALRQFPQWITVNNTFDQTVSILKGKSILSEGVGGVVTTTRKDWVKIFETEIKAMAKEANKQTVDSETKGFDYKDEKNIDNLYGQSFLLGYIAEMNNPKNAEKTVEELKNIVAKNMEKDPNYYIKNAMFGVEGLKGEQLETPKEPKGKFASSGMEPYKLKENMIKLTDLLLEEYSKEKKPVKKESIDSKLSEIEKQGKIATLETQIETLDELIESKTQRLSMISEDEDLAEIVDKNKIKEMQREIKELEKRKMKMEKLYEKIAGKSHPKSKIVDEEVDSDKTSKNKTDSRSGALSPVRADDFPLDKDDTDPAGGSGLASHV